MLQDRNLQTNTNVGVLGDECSQIIFSMWWSFSFQCAGGVRRTIACANFARNLPRMSFFGQKKHNYGFCSEGGIPTFCSKDLEKVSLSDSRERFSNFILVCETIGPVCVCKQVYVRCVKQL